MTAIIITQEVSATCKLAIRITQVSQDYAKFTSVVRVDGIMENGSDSTAKHLAANVSRSINGEGGYFPSRFSFSIAKGKNFTFITHTFTVKHGSDGTRSVTFAVNYGVTGLTRFPDNESVGATLALDTIPLRPGAPGQPQFSNEAQTKLTVSWDAPADDGGGSVNNYILRRYNGTTATGNPIESSGNATTRNITDLDPGATYTFTVVVQTNSKQNGGVSPASPPNTITMTAGVWIRYGGKWVKAIPYIRYKGVWKQAIPYVRSGGVWKKTS